MSAIGIGTTKVSNQKAKKIANIVYNLDSSEKYDYYEVIELDDSVLLNAIETCNISNAKNTSFEIEDDCVDIAYSLNYDLKSDTISVIITTSNEQGVINVEQLTAYPFIYDNGCTDAFIYLNDGSSLYLSEICSDKLYNCFALTLSFSVAALISSLITAAKVTLAITAVVVVAGVTIQVIEMTKEKLNEKTRAAEKEKTKKNPSCYYPATRKDKKLLIANAPQSLSKAAKNIVKNVDYWSPFDYTAKDLAIKASGGSIGPEIDAYSQGKYYHYHLIGRIGGHSFYGSPFGGVY